MGSFYFWHSLAISFLMLGSFFWGKAIGEKTTQEKVKK